MKHKKGLRLNAVALAVCLCISAMAGIPVSAADSHTENNTVQERLNTLTEEYSPGKSYFTSSSAGNDHNGNKALPCDTYDPHTGAYQYCGVFDGKTQCFAYARYAQYILFGKTEGGKTNFAIEGAGSIQYERISNPTKQDILKLPLGAHIRNDGYNSHSVILLKATETQITYLDCNCAASWNCAVHLHTVSWERFFSYYGIGSSSIYGYASYPSAATYPKPQPYGTTPFTDIGNHWAREDIQWAYERKITSGTTAHTFSPNSNITRGMLVTLVYQMDTDPEGISSDGFQDVTPDAYYYEAVMWAYANEFIHGTAPGIFEPNQFLTRQDAAVILYRYARSLDPDLNEQEKPLSGFSDQGDISAYAYDAISWAVDMKLMVGKTTDRLAPRDFMTRAEIVTVLRRFYALYTLNPHTEA